LNGSDPARHSGITIGIGSSGLRGRQRLTPCCRRRARRMDRDREPWQARFFFSRFFRRRPAPHSRLRPETLCVRRLIEMAVSFPRDLLSHIRLRRHTTAAVRARIRRSGGVINPLTFFLQRVDERLWSGKTRAKVALAVLFFSALPPSLMAGRRAEPF